MPEVRRYGGRRVDLNPLPDVRKQAAETNLSTGANLAEAQGQAAATKFGALGGVADTVGKVVFEERKKASDASTYAYNNELAAWKNRRLYTDPDAALNKHLLDAQGLPESVGAEFDQFADETADRLLKTPEARAAGMKVRAQMGTDLDLQLRQHSYTEGNKYHDSQVKGVLLNAVADGSTYAYQPHNIDEAIRKSVAVLKESAPLRGVSDEELQFQIDSQTAAVYKAVIDQRIADGHDKEAQEFFNTHSEEIKGPANAELKAKLDGATTQGEGLRASEEVYAKHGPKPGDERSPINVDVMRAELRDKYKDDTKTLNAALTYLNEHVQGVLDGRKQRSDSNVGALNKAASLGASYTQLTRMPQWAQISDEEQAKYPDYIRRRDADVQSTADKAKADKAYGPYWQLVQPEKLATLNPTAIEAMRMDLGDTLTNRLQEAYLQLKSSKTSYTEAKLDEEDFKADVTGIGLPGYATHSELKDSPEIETAIGKLHEAVVDALNIEQSKSKTPLSREQKAAIRTQVLDQKVLFRETSSWFGHTHDLDGKKVAAYPTAYAREVIKRSRWKEAYVPLGRISEAYRQEAITAIKGLNSAMQNVSDEQILAEYQYPIEHAVALRYLGGSTQEIVDALKLDERHALPKPRPAPTRADEAFTPMLRQD